MHAPLTRLPALAVGLVALLAGPGAAPATADAALVFDRSGDAPAAIDVEGVRVLNGERLATFVVGFDDLRPRRLTRVEVLIDTGPRYDTGWVVSVRRLGPGQEPRIRFARVLVSTDAPPERAPCPGIRVGRPGDGARPDIVRISVPQACMTDDARQLRMSVATSSRRGQDVVPDRRSSAPVARG